MLKLCFVLSAERLSNGMPSDPDRHLTVKSKNGVRRRKLFFMNFGSRANHLQYALYGVVVFLLSLSETLKYAFVVCVQFEQRFMNLFKKTTIICGQGIGGKFCTIEYDKSTRALLRIFREIFLLLLLVSFAQPGPPHE